MLSKPSSSFVFFTIISLIDFAYFISTLDMNIDITTDNRKHKFSSKNENVQPTKVNYNNRTIVSPSGVHVPKEVDKRNVCHADKPPILDLSAWTQCEKVMKESLKRGHPDLHKRHPQLLESSGYPHKEYQVKTMDGYFLRCYRITGSPKRGNKATKTPVYLNHGLTTSSDWWFFQFGNKNFAYKLADAGHEVWICNGRGTTYSLGHEKLDPDMDIDYWDFSFHEMGLYDVPAVTNTIITESGHKKIFYVGFSMASSQMFVALSELPEMNDKIMASFLLGPVAYMGHSTNFVRYIAPFLETEESFQVVNEAQRGRFPSNDDIRDTFKIDKNEACVASAAKCGFCDNFYFASLGINAPQINQSALPFILARMSNSASVKSFAHYSQLINSCKFQRYSYTPAKNMERYGSLQPPEYKLENIRSPIHIYVAPMDNWNVKRDLNLTLSRFSKGVIKRVYKVKDKLFNHMDFCMAKDADKLVYNKIMKEMTRYR